MYKSKNLVKKNFRTIDGVKLKTYETEITKYNSISVEVGTTGYKGGNYKKGGRTFIKIVDINDSNISVERNLNGKGFTIRAEGDSELDTLIDAFDFILSNLKTEKYNKIKKYKENKENDNEQEFSLELATDKQLKYINILLNKHGYALKTNKISKKIAQNLIEILTDRNVSVSFETYNEILKKI